MSSTKKVKQRKLKKETIVLEEEKLKEAVHEKDKFEKKVKDNSKNKKVKSRKIRMSYTENEEKELDKAIEVEDNFSITLMILILLICFVVGISLGYMLYRIAINSSNAMMIARYFLK